MNIFYLHRQPAESATYHCDKHVVKMVIEYAQLLSTAHRMLDGDHYIDASSGRRIQRWRLSESDREGVLYKASHVNHPSAIWVRKNKVQYQYMYELFVSLCDEYTHRYGRVHMTDYKLRNFLSTPPVNIPTGIFTDPPQCMPDNCKQSITVNAYREYYIKEKKGFAKWTSRQIPSWFNDQESNYASQ